MALDHDVALHTGTTGLRLDVWDAYDIALDMLQPGSPFAFTLWKSATREAAWSVLRENVRLGDRMFFSIDGATQMNGLIEEIEGRADRRGGIGLALSGRDLAGPAISWDADPASRLKGKPLDEALSTLFAPLGIGVRIGVRAQAAREVQWGTRRGPRAVTSERRRKVVDFSHPRPGEKVWQVAEAIVRRMGYLLWTAPDADEGLSVVVDAPDYDTPPRYALTRRWLDGNVTADSNVLESRYTVSIRDVPTEVRVYAWSARGDVVSARSSSVALNAPLRNPDVTGGYVVNDLLTQPRHIRATRARTLDACQKVAERAIADANQRLRVYQVTVQGHGQPTDGEPNLYAVNTLARVQDEDWGIAEDMLVTRVQFRGSREQGRTTVLSLVPKGSIVVTPDTET